LSAAFRVSLKTLFVRPVIAYRRAAVSEQGRRYYILINLSSIKGGFIVPVTSKTLTIGGSTRRGMTKPVFTLRTAPSELPTLVFTPRTATPELPTPVFTTELTRRNFRRSSLRQNRPAGTSDAHFHARTDPSELPTLIFTPEPTRRNFRRPFSRQNRPVGTSDARFYAQNRPAGTSGGAAMRKISAKI